MPLIDSEELEVRCEVCLYLDPDKTLAIGRCRRRSPVAMEVTRDDDGDPVYEGVFPVVEFDEWCGDFRHCGNRRGLQ